jgi:GTP-binding protein YchF
MALSIGIVGLPNVGKSTLFNALTEKQVDSANYPFCTIDPSVGVVPVPDKRLYELAEQAKSVKTVPAVVEFVDIAGLVRGASAGEGLGNKFLSNIRETDAIAHVVRIFEDDEIIHVENRIDPLTDIEIINLELIEADKQTITKRKENVNRDAKRGDKDAVREQDLLLKIEEVLNKDIFTYSFIQSLDVESQKIIKQLHLITDKPVLYVLNKDSAGENVDGADDERWENLVNYFREQDALWITVDAKTEIDLKEFDFEERAAIREEFGGVADDIDLLIQKGYQLLDLISYFTVGETETRAWTVPRNSTAPRAGRAIHGDFEAKFIRAEVISSQALLAAGSKAIAREKGLLKLEGKEYVVQDGDVIEFKI